MIDSNYALIETMENASFSLSTLSHERITRSLDIKKPSARTIQRRMTEYSVHLYTAAQRITLRPQTREKRQRLLSQEEYITHQFWEQFGFSNESHWGLGPRKKAKTHRRAGIEARNAPNKVQDRSKRSTSSRTSSFHTSQTRRSYLRTMIQHMVQNRRSLR